MAFKERSPSPLTVGSLRKGVLAACNSRAGPAVTVAGPVHLMSDWTGPLASNAMSNIDSSTPARSQSSGPWAPFGVAMFRWLWLAALFSNIGTWMHEVAAGWLMTELSTSRLMVALVQAATMGPVFLLGLPAGALADIVDRRRLLVFAQIWNFVSASLLAVMAFMGLVTPGLLLSLVGLLSIGTALHMPAFQAIVPDLVPRVMIKPAVTLNGVSVNLARAIGPALAGLIISVLGIWAAFAINAVTFLAILVVVWRWRPTPPSSRMPPEHLVRAVLVGLRYARHDRPLQIVLARAGLVMTCASAAWALLPVIIRSELERSAADYGIALAAIGLGAVSGAFLLPKLARKFPADLLVLIATIAFAGGMISMALLESFWLLVPCLVVLGLAWLTMMAILSASAQTVLPDWVRARGLSVFIIIFSGSMAIGAAVWGFVADVTTTSTALLAAASFAGLGCLLAPMLPLASGELRDLAPTKQMPVHADPLAADDTGAVQVLVHYRIDPADDSEFRRLLDNVRRWRLRTGAHTWYLFRDYDRPDHWVESFAVPGWVEHIRQHHRTTEKDWAFHQAACKLHRGAEPPRVVHLIVPQADGSIPSHDNQNKLAESGYHECQIPLVACERDPQGEVHERR